MQGSMDADRLAALHVPVTQLNTDPSFGGECHLDANMVRSALPALPLDEIDLLVIENVGNLVCPAEFKVGEDARVMVCSVTEGEDKPLKYPLMFRTCELVLVNKIDLLPHLDFDLDKLLYNLDVVHPGVERMLVARGPARASTSGATGSRRGRRAGGGARVTLGASRADRGSSEALAERTRANARVLRGRGRAARAAVPPDGRALRARRPADRVRRARPARARTPATSPWSSCIR